MPIGAFLQPDGDLEQGGLAARLPDQLKADRHSADVKARRDGERRQAEIIDETGEAAEGVKHPRIERRRERINFVHTRRPDRHHRQHRDAGLSKTAQDKLIAQFSARGHRRCKLFVGN